MVYLLVMFAVVPVAMAAVDVGGCGMEDGGDVSGGSVCRNQCFQVLIHCRHVGEAAYKMALVVLSQIDVLVVIVVVNMVEEEKSHGSFVNCMFLIKTAVQESNSLRMMM